MKKTTLALAIAAMATTAPLAQAVEWSLGGELAVELTDTDSSADLDLAVSTTDFVITVSETFGEVEVEGYQAFTKGETAALDRDGAGISVSGAFGSVFIGDDGTGVFAGGVTDVMYNNSEKFYADPTTNVIDYGLPLGDDFSLNVFVDITSGDSEDIDAVGFYGSYGLSGITLLFGYTSLTEDGDYASGDDDSIVDFAVAYEGGPIAAGIGFQDQDSAVDSIFSAFLTYTTGPWAFTPYIEDAGDAGDVVAFNVSYSFTDNFYIFFETASFSDEAVAAAVGEDNSEVGLVLTF